MGSGEWGVGSGEWGVTGELLRKAPRPKLLFGNFLVKLCFGGPIETEFLDARSQTGVWERGKFGNEEQVVLIAYLLPITNH